MMIVDDHATQSLFMLIMIRQKIILSSIHYSFGKVGKLASPNVVLTFEF